MSLSNLFNASSTVLFHSVDGSSIWLLFERFCLGMVRSCWHSFSLTGGILFIPCTSNLQLLLSYRKIWFDTLTTHTHIHTLERPCSTAVCVCCMLFHNSLHLINMSTLFLVQNKKDKEILLFMRWIMSTFCSCHVSAETV